MPTKLLRRRPSPALVVSIVALVVATSGTGYAAFRLPAHSVGTTQLKSGAVRSAQVANGSLLKRDFRAGQLPRGATGPQGPKGDRGPTGAQGAQGPQGPKGDTGTVDTSQFYDKSQSDQRYAAAGRMVFGQADWGASSSQRILSIPEIYGLTISTVPGHSRLLLKTDISQITPVGHELCLFAEDTPGASGGYCLSAVGGLDVGDQAGVTDVGTLRPYTWVFAIADHPDLSVQVTCTWQDRFNQPRIVRCWALRSGV